MCKLNKGQTWVHKVFVGELTNFGWGGGNRPRWRGTTPWWGKPLGRRKKVQVEKSSNRRKSQTFSSNFFWLIWKQRSYNNGRPLILKLVPNDEEWNDRISWFIWNWQRKSILKLIVTVLQFSRLTFMSK